MLLNGSTPVHASTAAKLSPFSLSVIFLCGRACRLRSSKHGGKRMFLHRLKRLGGSVYYTRECSSALPDYGANNQSRSITIAAPILSGRCHIARSRRNISSLFPRSKFDISKNSLERLWVLKGFHDAMIISVFVSDLSQDTFEDVSKLNSLKLNI